MIFPRTLPSAKKLGGLKQTAYVMTSMFLFGLEGAMLAIEFLKVTQFMDLLSSFFVIAIFLVFTVLRRLNILWIRSFCFEIQLLSFFQITAFLELIFRAGNCFCTMILEIYGYGLVR